MEGWGLTPSRSCHVGAMARSDLRPESGQGGLRRWAVILSARSELDEDVRKVTAKVASLLHGGPGARRELSGAAARARQLPDEDGCKAAALPACCWTAAWRSRPVELLHLLAMCPDERMRTSTLPRARIAGLLQGGRPGARRARYGVAVMSERGCPQGSSRGWKDTGESVRIAAGQDCRPLATMARKDFRGVAVRSAECLDEDVRRAAAKGGQPAARRAGRCALCVAATGLLRGVRPTACRASP